MKTIASIFFILGTAYAAYEFYSVTRPWKNIDNEEIKIAYNYLKEKDSIINMAELVLLVVLAYAPLGYVKYNTIPILPIYAVVAIDIAVSITIQWIISSRRKRIYQEGLRTAYRIIQKSNKD